MHRRWSLNNIYAYMPDLFDDLQLPTGYVKSDFVDTLLAEYGDMSIARHITAFKKSITLWGRRNDYMLRGLLATTTATYNPIENFDRYEDYTDKRHAATGSTGSSANNTQSSGTGVTNSSSKESTYEHGELLDTAAAKNESSQKDTVSATSATEQTANTEENVEHVAHLHGNIGVTTTQEMLESERKIVNYDVYLAAANAFALDLLVQIYF